MRHQAAAEQLLTAPLHSHPIALPLLAMLGGHHLLIALNHGTRSFQPAGTQCSARLLSRSSDAVATHLASAYG